MINDGVVYAYAYSGWSNILVVWLNKSYLGQQKKKEAEMVDNLDGRT
jgi:hypothetical protein